MLLVLALTAVSYAVGRAVGPVAPGLHRVEEGPDRNPGMHGMHGMHGTEEGR